MKKLFLILTLFASICAMSQENVISPTACGITVGETTKNGKTMEQWSDILKDYRPMNPIVLKDDQEVFWGNFVVEGLHMSVMNVKLKNDTVYEISFYEDSPYADCWDLYKDVVFKLRDKYAHFENVSAPLELDNDSTILFHKTDGKTIILFYASPHSISLTLTNVHFQNIIVNGMTEALKAILSDMANPNYDEKNKVTSIAGVRFGETRTNTINSFKQRGTFLENENMVTYFSNVNFGGSLYNIATLFFQYDSRRYDLVLSAAKFEKNFYAWRKEEALMMYNAVVSQFKGKYTNCTILKDEEDSKAMVCGMLEDDYAGGKMPPILVSLELGVSRGGDKFYYVTVSYFGQRISSVVSDDL